jgi:hypothetical protein
MDVIVTKRTEQQYHVARESHDQNSVNLTFMPDDCDNRHKGPAKSGVLVSWIIGRASENSSPRMKIILSCRFRGKVPFFAVPGR